MEGLPFFNSLRKNRLYIGQDLNPRSPYWLITGGIFGLLIWLTARPKVAMGHVLLHERGIIQPISQQLHLPNAHDRLDHHLNLQRRYDGL